MKTLRVVIASVVVLAATGVVSATAQAPAPRDPTTACPGVANPLPGETCGDHYLESVRIRTNPVGGGRLQGFSDSVDTSKATVQPDMFKPGGNRVGPGEPVTCGGTPYGKTVWYDFVPSTDGDLLVQAAGATFNPVLAIVRFDVGDTPNFRPAGPFECSNQGAAALEQISKRGVKRGRGYSIQLGGVGGAGGPVDVDVNFTPYRVRATPKLAFQLTPAGVRLVSLRVNASRRSRVEVTCRPGCGRRVERGRRLSFGLAGKRLKAGSRLFIRVTRGGEIGAHFVYKVRRGKVPVQTERCLNPGSRAPRKSCG